MISKHLDKNNLHHAYLIEGERDHTVSEITKFCASIDIKTEGNPDFCHIAIDSFKIDEAFMLRSMSFDKPFSSVKKIFSEIGKCNFFLLVFLHFYCLM